MPKIRRGRTRRKLYRNGLNSAAQDTERVEDQDTDEDNSFGV